MGRKYHLECNTCKAPRGESIRFVGSYCAKCYNKKRNASIQSTRIITCKMCNGPRDVGAQYGRLCHTCYKLQAKHRRKGTDDYTTDFLPLEMNPLIVNAPKTYNKKECLIWIESVMKRGGYVDLKGINGLITVYNTIGERNIDCYSAGKQLELMWKACIAFYRMKKKVVLENNI